MSDQPDIYFHPLVNPPLLGDDRWEVVTKKPILPSPQEVQINPRARSAKLRIAKRTTITKSP